MKSAMVRMTVLQFFKIMTGFAMTLALLVMSSSPLATQCTSKLAIQSLIPVQNGKKLKVKLSDFEIEQYLNLCFSGLL